MTACRGMSSLQPALLLSCVVRRWGRRFPDENGDKMGTFNEKRKMEEYEIFLYVLCVSVVKSLDYSFQSAGSTMPSRG